MVFDPLLRLVVVHVSILLLALVAAGGEARAQPPVDEARVPPPVGAGDADKPRGLFEKGSIGVEAGGAALGEAWNLNDRREWLADGSLGVWWAFARRATLVVEFHVTRVFQDSSRDASVNGLVPLVRWRLADTRAGSLFVELGPGISWSDTRVPPRGTQFNYLIQGGAGFVRRLGQQTQAVIGARWLHLSNASREGRSRNPDIEALGGYAGVVLAF
jgi:hypothetical protein